MNYKLKIGLIPERRYIADWKTRRGMFSPEYAVKNKEKVISYIKTHFSDEMTEFTDLAWLNEEGILHDTADCVRVQRYLEAERVDAIFIINCNFGNEEAAGTIARLMKLPVLLWGPQDVFYPPNDARFTDTQCGLFAISRQLRNLHIPFSYIENCPVEDEMFAKGLRRFLSVTAMVRCFRNLTITQLGTRLNPFKSVMSNELELTERFGFNLQTVNMAVAAQKFHRIMNEQKALLVEELSDLRANYDTEDADEEMLIKTLALVHVYEEIFRETGADVMTTECWTAMPQAFGITPCLAMSILADRGLHITCESDICGAVTNALLLSAARGKEPPVFGEFTCRHPSNKNAELLWHCGVFAASQRAEGERARICGGKPCFRVKDGHYTIARFQGDSHGYTLLAGSLHTTDGPVTTGTYLWGEFDDLARVERKLIDGPYIHHMSEISGDYTAELEEFCRFVPSLTFDPIGEGT